jgi:hypothetical protein
MKLSLNHSDYLSSLQVAAAAAVQPAEEPSTACSHNQPAVLLQLLALVAAAATKSLLSGQRYGSAAHAIHSTAVAATPAQRRLCLCLLPTHQSNPCPKEELI